MTESSHEITKWCKFMCYLKKMHHNRLGFHVGKVSQLGDRNGL